MKNYRNKNVGEIATEVPGATAVFRKHHINFCCKGGQTIDEACAEKSIPVEIVINEINETSTTAKDSDLRKWLNEPFNNVIDHIISHYHEGHRRMMPELLLLAERVERVHANHTSCPQGLSDFLSGVWDELKPHLEIEEKILFQLLKEGYYKEATLPIQVMTNQHDEHSQSLDKLHELKKMYPMPEDACRTWRALFANLDQFEQELTEHIHLENNILFQRVLAAQT